MSEALRKAIEPKSDQLNSEQLIAGDIIITVTRAKVTLSAEQKVTINYKDDNGRPYKPCKTMTKLLAALWGDDEDQWVGKSMKLYFDPEVFFGKEKTGGSRISEVTDIPTEWAEVSLTVKRGQKKTFRIKRLDMKFTPENNAAYVTPLPAFNKEACLKSLKDAAQKGTADLLAVWNTLTREAKAAVKDDMTDIKTEAAKHDKPVDGFDD